MAPPKKQASCGLGGGEGVRHPNDNNLVWYCNYLQQSVSNDHYYFREGPLLRIIIHYWQWDRPCHRILGIRKAIVLGGKDP